MKIEYYTYPDAPILFRGGVGIYIILTLYFLISGELFGGSLLFSVPWILLGGYGLFYFALMPYHILFDENQVEYKTLCGKVKTFPVRGVSFREKEEYSKSKGSYWVLCIYFPKYRIKIHRDDNPQYTKILNYCQQHLLKKYNEYRDTRYLIPFYIGVIFIGVHFSIYLNAEPQRSMVLRKLWVLIANTQLALPKEKENGTTNWKFSSKNILILPLENGM